MDSFTEPTKYSTHREVPQREVEGMTDIDMLRAALQPFADLASTWTVQTAANAGELLTVSNGKRMCGIPAQAFIAAALALSRGGKP